MPKPERTAAQRPAEFAAPVSLHGRYASLVSLVHAFRDQLVEATNDGEMRSLWYAAVPAPEQMTPKIDRRLGLRALVSMRPFAVIERSGCRHDGQRQY